jgi:predicted MPP superfamily phosphohydrolase
MRGIEPFRLRLRRVDVRLRRADPFPPLNLLHLSDFHLSEVVPLEHVRRAIGLGLACGPDLACITGDFVTGDIPTPEAYLEGLRDLSARVPTFACLGNHDGGRWAGHHGARLETDQMRDFLARAGIRCLFNEATGLRLRGVRLDLVGVGDLWANEVDAAKAFRGRDAGVPCVALCHNPDAKDLLAAYPWDLLLCGHTHGGQLRLPLLGTPFAPVRDHRYVAGLHQWSGRWLYVSAGVGNLHGLRFNCPPEVGLLALTGAGARS